MYQISSKFVLVVTFNLFNVLDTLWITRVVAEVFILEVDRVVTSAVLKKVSENQVHIDKIEH